MIKRFVSFAVFAASTCLLSQAHAKAWGVDMVSAGDLDGDDKQDMIASWASPFLEVNGRWYAVRLDGSVIWTADAGGLVPTYMATPIVALREDLNGDGQQEFVAANSYAGLVVALDGATGERVWEWDGEALAKKAGTSLLRFPDLTGDGIADVVVGAPGSDWYTETEDSSAIVALDGATGEVIWVHLAEYPGLGYALDNTSDRDGDGVPEIFVGSANETRGPGMARGGVRMLSGATGHELISFTNPGLPGFRDSLFGMDLIAVADFGGGPEKDLIVGMANFYGRPGTSGVIVIDGTTGAILCDDLHPAGGDGYGTTLIGAYRRAVDSPVYDLVVGAPDAGRGYHSTLRLARAGDACSLTVTSTTQGPEVGSASGSGGAMFQAGVSLKDGSVVAAPYFVSAPEADVIELFDGSAALIATIASPQ